MSSPDNRVDRLIDAVARTMTDAPAPDVTTGLTERLRSTRRVRARWLVPAVAAAAIAMAVVSLIERRAPWAHPAGTTDHRTQAVAQTSAGGVAPSDVAPPRVAPLHVAPHIARVASVTRKSSPLPPPLVTDLTPAPITVAPVGVPAIDPPSRLSPAPLEVTPLAVDPIETTGGSR